MPSVSSLRIKSGTGSVSVATGNNATTGTAGNPPTISQVSFTVSTPSSGIALFDSSSVSGNNIILALRSLVAGSGLSIVVENGIITIASSVTAQTGNLGPTGPTGPTGPSGESTPINSLPDGDRLSGTEELAVLQGSTLIKTTTHDVSYVGLSKSSVKIGALSNIDGFSAVAVGYYATATGGTASTALGSIAYAIGLCATAVGYTSHAGGAYSVALGRGAQASSLYSVALGSQTNSGAANTIAIGGRAEAGYAGSIAIGYHSTTETSEHGVAIGVYASASYGSISIGFHSNIVGHDSICIGNYSYAQLNAIKGIAIGSHASVYNYYSIAIGCGAVSNDYGGLSVGAYSATSQRATAIGTYANANSPQAVAFGYDTNANQHYSMAFGSRSQANANNSIALGAFANTRKQYSTVIGSNSADLVSGSFVVSGVPVEGSVHPADHYQKFVGQTRGAIKPTAGWGDGFYLATVTYDTTGPTGNSYVLSALIAGISTTLNVTWDGTNLNINLGTTGGGTPDDAQNTLANIAALFPTNGFTFHYTSGFDASVLTSSFTESFSNGSDGSPTTVLTSDGNSPVDDNTPSMWSGSTATISGRVVGIGQNVYESSDDVASFILEPCLVVRKDDNTYLFVNDPTFVLENGTAGTSDWPLPTLDRENVNTEIWLNISNNINPVVNWMAHLVIQGSA